MSSETTADQWVVFQYEVDMFLNLCPLLTDGNPEYAALGHWARNAVVESVLLHARQLADILLSKGNYPNDISLKTLLPGFTPKRIVELQSLYGTRTTKGSPCEVLNTRLAHATMLRGASYDYSPLLNQLYPLLREIGQEVLSHRE